MVTDPPYGLNREVSRWGVDPVANDQTTELRDWVLDLWGNKPSIVFGTWKVQRPPNVRGVLIWDKGPGVGMGDRLLPLEADARRNLY